MIGIIQVIQAPTILVGPSQTKPSQFTIHAQPVGVFLMEEMMVFGRQLSVLRLISQSQIYTIVPTEV